jgi:hypothetical protein
MNSSEHPIRTRLLGLAATTGLVLTATLFATAAPAHALAGATLVATPSLSTSSAKSATAFCPPDTKVFGAGAKIVDGDGNVHVTDIIPAPNLLSVTAHGTENGLYLLNWTVIAYAICAPEGNHSLYLVTQPSTVDGTSTAPRSAFAFCDHNPGDVLFGSGFQLNDAGGEVFIAEMEPDVGLLGEFVEVEGREDGPNITRNWDLTAYAICGQPAGATVDWMSATSTFDSDRHHSATTADCPAGSTVTGIGGKVSDSFDDVMQDRFSVNDLMTATTATGREDGNNILGDWSETAFAICVS